MNNKQFDQIQSKVREEIDILTDSTIKKLTEIWTKLYEPSVCEDNIRVLKTHVDTFYNEILDECKQREDRITSDIKDLQEEISNLCRQLNIDNNYIDLDDNVDDDGNKLPLFQVKYKLDDNLRELCELLEQRKNELMKLHLEENELCMELDIKQRKIHVDMFNNKNYKNLILPTENDIRLYREYLIDLKTEKENRITEMARLRHDIKRLFKDLDIFDPSDEEKCILNDRHLSLSMDILNQLRKMCEFYTEQMSEMIKNIDKMKIKLEKLWDYLCTDIEHRKKFNKYVNKYTKKIYEIYHQELERCENEKRENLEKFIGKIRVEIYEWWEKCLKSDTERKRFIYFTNDCYTEDLLNLHELELDELKMFYENNKKIFQLYEERNKLWNQMIALEAQASEPGRLNNRGGKLLQEERERKAVAIKLPKIEEKLKELVLEYENKNNRKFTVDGEDILELIDKQWEKRHEEKEKLMSARKNNAAVTPLSVRNHQVTASVLKRATSIRNVSSVPPSLKRQLTEKETLNPKAKRQLLSVDPQSILQSPKPLSKSSAQKSVKKKRIIATIINRQSGRYSNNSRRNHRKSKAQHKDIPKILVNDTIPTDSTSYDVFEQRIEKDPSARSSILLKDDLTNDYSKMKKVRRNSKKNIAAISSVVKSSPLPTSTSRRMTRSRAKLCSRLPTPKKTPKKHTSSALIGNDGGNNTVVSGNNRRTPIKIGTPLKGMSVATAISPSKATILTSMAGPQNLNNNNASNINNTSKRPFVKEIPILF